MEMIKAIVKTHFELLILTGCILFVMGVFFSSEKGKGMGIFESSGFLFSTLIKDTNFVSSGVEHLAGYVSEYIPSVHYKEGALQIGDCVEFKSMLEVRLEDGTVVSGNTEKGFTLYLTDVCTNAGNSVLEKMTTDELAGMEEIPSAFVYDKDLDMLYIFGSGTYTILAKIYTDAGAMENYEFQLPVELQ